MAEIEIPNGYGQAVMRWGHAELAAPVSVTCGFQVVGPQDPIAAAEAISTEWTLGARPATVANMLVGWRFEGVYVLLRDELGGLQSGYYAANVNGEQVLSGAQGNPAYSPLVVSKLSARAGRRYRGRMYPPAAYASEGSVNVGGNLDQQSLDHNRAIYNNLYTGWAATEYPPVILHTDPAGPDATPPPTPIRSFLVRPVLGSQRRRKNR